MLAGRSLDEIGPLDGHDIGAVEAAIAQARRGRGKPTLIVCRTTIGAGSPGRAGTAKAHGEPLGVEEIAATREALGWFHPPFELPDDARNAWDAREAGERVQAQWQARFEAYRAAHPELAAELERRMAGTLPTGWDALRAAVVEHEAARTDDVATRKASQQVLVQLAPELPEMFGGSADLTGSNLTDFPDAGARHLSYGVREFGMAAVMNGMALHGGFIPYGGTFLTFSDYSRNAIRMAALMNQRVIHVFTHDSIGLGEDGPTHQSIEHVSSLRLIPNLDVWRPCDTVETAVAWKLALERRNAPTALALSRQNLPFVPRSEAQVAAIGRGGYVLADSDGTPARILVATGSEVGLALAAKKLLDADGLPTRVVSMPSTEAFDRQDDAYRASVLPADVPKIAIEAGATALWWKYVRGNGAVVGIDRYGESAPAGKLFEFFGFTPEHVAEVARSV